MRMTNSVKTTLRLGNFRLLGRRFSVNRRKVSLFDQALANGVVPQLVEADSSCALVRLGCFEYLPRDGYRSYKTFCLIGFGDIFWSSLLCRRFLYNALRF